MTSQEHENPKSRERAAWAPYNFVPLPEAVVAAEQRPDRDHYDPERLTGAIHCTLTTETPLYTRAALELDEYGSRTAKEKADFFYVDPATRKPVIPGSTLRGMLRSLVEIIVYGKVQPVTNRQLFFRTLDTSSVGEAYRDRMTGGDAAKEGWRPLASAGYLERRNNDFFIRPAQELKGAQHYRVEEAVARQAIRELRPMAFEKKDGKWGPEREYRDGGWLRRQVWFKPVAPTSHLPESPLFFAEITELSVKPRPETEGWHQGWLIASGWVPSPGGGRGKHRHWIVGPPVEDDEQLIPIQSEDVEAYQEDGAGMTQAIRNNNLSVLPSKNGERKPCFYRFWTDSEGKEHIAFGHTGMFRLPYEYSPRDLLPDYLKDPTITDMAEAIFGWVDSAKGRQIAGRVYVSDAHVTQAPNGLFVLGEREPPVQSLLSGPKPTSFQHYLTQRTDKKDDLFNYQDLGKTTLRGHKLYWHKHPDLKRSEYDDRNWTPSSTQHTSLRPVKEGVSFAFDIRFENLTEAELGAVLWGLTVCGDGNFRLKLGMVKPFGLGTVRLQTTLHLSNRKRRYQNILGEWDESQEYPDEVQPYVAAFEEKIWEALPEEARSGAHSFRSLKRIRKLLLMLRWPGPGDTEYMKLEEFKQRPVLPDPQAVWDQSKPALQSEKSTPRAVQFAVATVLEVKGSNIVVQVGDQQFSLQFDQLPQKVRDYKEVAYLYPVGSILRVKIEQTKKDKLRATAKDVPQP